MPDIVDTRVVYLAFIAAVGVQRLFEVSLSTRHARKLLERGGVESGRGHLPWMILFHVCFLCACPAEVFLAHRPFAPVLAAAAVLVFAAAQALRYWAIASLGERWSIRVIVLPEADPVVRGPYRFIRHPNYLAVILEVAALPLIHTAYITALAGSAVNAVLLVLRVRAEERLLRTVGGDSAALFARPRFAPRV